MYNNSRAAHYTIAQVHAYMYVCIAYYWNKPNKTNRQDVASSKLYPSAISCFRPASSILRI